MRRSCRLDQGVKLLLIFVLNLLYGASCVAAGWQEDVRPRSIVRLAENDVQKFPGNHSHVDHFKLLEQDGDALLVGARNVVYNISLRELSENQRLEWHANEAHIGLCQMKGKSEDDCQNYIRVLAKTNDSRILICGTNAYKPMCRYYYMEDGAYKLDKEVVGQGLCPYDIKHNSTAVFADGSLYVATVADFSGTDPLIYRDPLRTQQYDFKQLNAPNFVSSLNHGEFVYFFFRETAVEYMNCGKTVYSRVARVCKNDKGGPYNYGNRWTSFLKARLNCSVGGEFPFYFNEIQSTTSVVDGVYANNEESLVYGVFTTPLNSLSGSAICAFRVKDIVATFDGPFKGQETTNSNWLPIPGGKVPDPRPGQCVNDSRTLPDFPLNFIKSHTLMDQAVPAFWGSPLVIHTSIQYRFTQITVDPQVRAPDGKTYDVLFIGTDNGKVIKALNADSPTSSESINPVVMEEIQVFAPHMAVTNMMVFRKTGDSTEDGKLVVVSKDEIQAIHLQRCYSDKITSCAECVKLQDPYCAWDVKNHRCTSSGSPDWGDEFVQNVALGEHPRCPSGRGSASTTPLKSSSTSSASSQQQPASAGRPGRNHDDDDLANEVPTSMAGTDEKAGPTYGASRESPPIYTAETLAIAVATSIVVALIVGFVSGFLFSRRCRNEEVDTLYTDERFGGDQRRNLGAVGSAGGGVGGGVGMGMGMGRGLRDPAGQQSHMNHSDASYLGPLPTNNKPINLVLNVPPKNGNGKNANSSADNKPAPKKNMANATRPIAVGF